TSTVLVIAITENLLIRVTPVAIGGQELLLISGAGEAQQPLGAGKLRCDFGERRQQLRGRDPRERDVLELRRVADLHTLLDERMKLQRASDAQRIGAGVELGEFILAVDVAVDGGADRALLRDELHHDALKRLAAV